MGAVVEIVTFRLIPKTSEAAFLAAVAQSLAFLERQPGFVRREAGVAADREWTDIVHWANLEAALHAAKVFNEAPETRAFNDCLARGSVQMRHLRSVYRSDEDTSEATAAS